jgi:TetR/AcrR family transcriptional regulator, transcriptional repressor of bet genes
MPKVGIQHIRRRQLIAATIETIHAYGYDDTTIARIASRAGLSSGIISHYFGSKAELLAATMRSLLSDLRRQAADRLARATAPLDRIGAVVEATFDDTQCTPQVVTAWLAFWAQVPHVPELARLQSVYHRRLRSNLRRELRRLSLGDRRSNELVEVLGSLIDGIWVRAALTGSTLDTTGARRRVMETLHLHLGSEDRPAGPARRE